jgi:hypothetical protein
VWQPCAGAENGSVPFAVLMETVLQPPDKRQLTDGSQLAYVPESWSRSVEVTDWVPDFDTSA